VVLACAKVRGCEEFCESRFFWEEKEKKEEEEGKVAGDEGKFKAEAEADQTRPDQRWLP